MRRGLGEAMKPTTNLQCGVRGRLGARPVTMESGVVFNVCAICKEDRYASAEAEKRARR